MQTLSQQTMKEKIESNDNALLVNVLPRESFEEEHIPGSLNIPQNQDDFVEQIKNRTQDQDQDIIVYCASTECDASEKAAEKLEKAGFSNVYDYEGGMKDWKKAGNKVEGKDKPTQSASQHKGKGEKAESNGCC